MNIFGKEYNRPSWIPRWVSITGIVAVVFIITMLFLGDNNYIKVQNYEKQIKNLKSEIKANKDSASLYEAKTRELHTDKATLERIAREKYGMKRANEDVYVTEIP